MTCAACATENPSDARFCKSCGAALTPAPAEAKPVMPPWPTAGQPYRPTAAYAATRPVASPPAPTSTPTGITVAVVIYFLLAAITGGLGALQMAIGAVGFGVVNVAVGALYALVGYWILRREERGYSWGLGSAVLSIIVTIAQVVIAPNILVALIPLYVLAAVILWTNRAAFK